MPQSSVLPSSVEAKTKLLSIEAARGIAAAMVVFYHAARHLKADHGYLPWHGISQFGHAGVDFFFVLSGFIIFFVHHADLGAPRRLFSYLGRRFTRVYPLFWFSLLVGLALGAMSQTPKPFDPASFLASATLLSSGIDVGVAWTLQHEILFYLIFSIAIINLRIGLLLGGVWLALVIANLLLGFSAGLAPITQRLLSEYNIEFFFGMTAAWLFLKWNTKQKFAPVWLSAGILVFAATAILENAGQINGYAAYARLLYGIGSMLIILGIAGMEWQGRLKPGRFLVALGSASYSIYLMHLPCIGVSYKLIGFISPLAALPTWMLYPMLVSIAIIGGFLVSIWVEKPLLRGFRRVSGRRSAYRRAAAG
jgi:peptidoglycan/LPS O-acetylase OafA/YrhL